MIAAQRSQPNHPAATLLADPENSVRAPGNDQLAVAARAAFHDEQ
jgi:hypothetical protein